MKVTIPMRLPSLANCRMHWRKLARLKREQATWVLVALNVLKLPKTPLVVTITRVGPKRLDDDNLISSMKAVQDQVAKMVGVDDGSHLYTWVRRQRINKTYSVEIEIEPR